MTNYFVIIKDEQSGPYTIEQLKNLGIHAKSMIWHEGLSDWQEADKIIDLKELFQNQPPPFKKQTFVDHSQDQKSNKTRVSQNNTSSESKPVLWTVLVISALAIILLIFVNQQKNQEQMNSELSRQQQQLDEQEAERIAEEQRVAEEMRQTQYRKLKSSYDNAVNNLRLAKIQLDDIAAFHFLRTPDEKEAEISTQLEVVRSWENEVERLKYKLDNF